MPGGPPHDRLTYLDFDLEIGPGRGVSTLSLSSDLVRKYSTAGFSDQRNHRHNWVETCQVS